MTTKPYRPLPVPPGLISPGIILAISTPPPTLVKLSYDEFATTAPALVRETVVVSPSGRRAILPMPRDGAHAAVVPRARLDAALADLARRRGVEVHEGHAVEKLVEHAAKTGEFGVDEVDYGWNAGRHIFDDQFSFAHNVYNDCLFFALRIDTNKVPGTSRRRTR